MEYPVGISYWAWGTAWVTHWLSGSPDLGPRYAAPVDEVSGCDGVRAESRLFVAVTRSGSPRSRCSRSGCSPAYTGDDRGTRRSWPRRRRWR